MLQAVSRPISESESAETVLSSLLDAFRPRPTDAYLCLSRRQAFVKFASLPSTRPDELRSMARMELLRQVPYEEEEICDGVRILRQQPEGYADVLAVSATRQTVLAGSKLLMAAGLRVQDVVFGMEGILLWLNAAYPECQSKTVLLVLAAEDYFEWIVLDHGRPVLSRYSDFQPLRLSEELSQQAELTLSAHEKASGLRAESVVELGLKHRADLRAWSEEIRLPVVSLDPAKEFPEPLSAWLRQSPGLLSLAASAFFFERSHIRLLPGELVQARSRADYARELIKTLVWLGALVAALVFIRLEFDFFRSRSIQRLDREWQAVAPRALVLEKAERRFKNSSGLSDASAVDVFAEVHRLTPEAIRVASVDYKFQKGIQIAGQAESAAQVLDWVKSLEKSTLWMRPRVGYVTRRNDMPPAVDFEVDAEWPASPGGRHD